MSEHREVFDPSAPPDKLVDNGELDLSRESGRPWMYKQIKVAGVKLPWYASPISQLLVVSFVCFLCPGMFNAVNGLGGGGQIHHQDNNDALTALYSTFAVVGFFAGSIANRLGLRYTLFFGGFGYFLYVSSILSYDHNQNAGFLVFAGALLGACAGCLWAAQGAIMTSYPEEHMKGRYISWFWIIFNLGGVIGSLVPLGQNIHSMANAVNDGTYIAFMVLMFIGFILSFCLVDAKHVRRADGSHVILMKNPTWKSELWGLVEVMKTDYYIVLFFPMFWSSNWFYTYQFNNVNAARFNIRTRALNDVLYWLFQMIGALLMGNFLDLRWFRRTIRARAGWAVIFILTMGIWGGGFVFQNYTKADVDPDLTNPPVPRLDWTDSGYIGPMFLYIFYGVYDAAFQTCVYWFLGALTNNSRKLANFVGFYKGIQSAGAAVTWKSDNFASFTLEGQFATCWGLLIGSLLVAAPIVFLKIKDSVDLAEDLKFSDETIEEVAPSQFEDPHSRDEIKV